LVLLPSSPFYNTLNHAFRFVDRLYSAASDICRSVRCVSYVGARPSPGRTDRTFGRCKPLPASVVASAAAAALPIDIEHACNALLHKSDVGATDSKSVFTLHQPSRRSITRPKLFFKLAATFASHRTSSQSIFERTPHEFHLLRYQCAKPIPGFYVSILSVLLHLLFVTLKISRFQNS